MTTRLRSNYEEGSSFWAVRRAQWLAMGLTEEDLLKPKIAVVNSSSRLSICYAHLDGVAAEVSQAIRAAGGVPFEIRTVAPSDFITTAGKQGRYLMPSRDLLVNDVEVQVEGALLDGMVLLASCDKTTPGQLMAAARLDIPSIVVPCGYQLGGHCTSGPVDIEELYKSVGTYKAGQISLSELREMSCEAIKGPGVCAGLATANTMHILAEALGMALSGSAPVRAGSSRMLETARAAGRQIVRLVESGPCPRAILGRSAFENAVKVLVSIGGSVNTVRHLIAIAAEAECKVDVIGAIEACSHLSQITMVRPNGPHRIEELDAAGGARGIMKALSNILDLECATVNGRTLGELLSEAPVPDRNVIRPRSDPFRKEPGLVILRGNLAPAGAVGKASAFPRDIRRFTGPARIFEREEDAIDALGNAGVRPGEVIVLRNLGVMGGPGTVFACSFMAALAGAGLASQVAVITDGELSGLNSGITIGQVMPEAAEGGPLAAIRNGDVIRIDLDTLAVDVMLDDEEIARRMEDWRPNAHAGVKGYLKQYAALVQPLSKGAVLGKRQF